MGKVAAEIVHTCKELLHLVNNHLIPTDSTVRPHATKPAVSCTPLHSARSPSRHQQVTGKVFYHKMAGGAGLFDNCAAR